MAGQWRLILKEASWSKEYLFNFLVLVNGYIQTHTYYRDAGGKKSNYSIKVSENY